MASEREEDLLSRLLENGQLGPAIKAVFDRGWKDNYQGPLEAHIEGRAAEIRELCGENYGEFITATHDLMSGKSDLARLREKVRSFNERVQDSGEALLDKASELMELRYERRNMTSALDVLNRCQHVMGLASKAMEQIAQKKYFAALRTLDQLQRHSAKLPGKRFADYIEAKVPGLYDQIVKAVHSEFYVWVTEVEGKAQEVGARAMIHVADQRREEERSLRRRRNKAAQAAAAQASDPQQPGVAAAAAAAESVGAAEDDAAAQAAGFHGMEDDARVRSPEVALDFSPVYQCLHICEQLQQRQILLSMADKFRQTYQEKRKAHLDRVVARLSGGRRMSDPSETFKTSADATPQIVSAFDMTFAQLAGFFIVEDSVLKSGNQLMPKSQLETVWAKTLTKIQLLLSEQFQLFVTQPREHLQLKDTVALFCHTMEVHGLNASPLLQFVFETRDHFQSLLTSRLQVSVSKLFEKEKWEALTVEMLKEYMEFIVPFGLIPEEIRLQSAHPPDAQLDDALGSSASIAPMGASSSSLHGTPGAMGEEAMLDFTPSGAHIFGYGQPRGSMSMSSAAASVGRDTGAVAPSIAYPGVPIPAKFPVVMPYSVMVPMVCRFLERFMEDLGEFSLGLRSSNMHIWMQQTIDKALIRQINDKLVAVLDAGNASISQVCQISINAGAFAAACDWAEAFAFYRQDPRESAAFHFSSAREVFSRTETRAQDHICELVTRKTDAVLELGLGLGGAFDWLAELTVDAQHEFIDELIMFLETTFSCMVFMPLAFRQSISFTVCGHISSVILTEFAQCKKWNVEALQNLDFDVAALEDFAAAQAADLEAPALKDAFLELRQIVNLFFGSSVTDILDPKLRDLKFGRINLDKLLAILHSFKGQGKGVFDRDTGLIKKKTVDQVAKKLKDLL